MRKLKLSSLKGLDKFQAALMNEALPAMVGWLKSKKKADLLMTEVHKHIFELGPPTPPEKRTGRSNYYQLLTYHLAEIQTTLDTMRDIEFYMGRFPYSEEKVAKHRHLIFHVQAFLNELYILQQRLLGFLKFIERQHRKDTRLDNIKVVCEALRGFVNESMKKGRDPGEPRPRVEAFGQRPRPAHRYQSLHEDAERGDTGRVHRVLRLGVQEDSKTAARVGRQRDRRVARAGGRLFRRAVQARVRRQGLDGVSEPIEVLTGQPRKGTW